MKLETSETFQSKRACRIVLMCCGTLGVKVSSPQYFDESGVKLLLCFTDSF